MTATLYDYTRGDKAKSIVLSAECWVLSTECSVHSAEYWVLTDECCLLEATAVRGYQVFLSQVVCQKQKAQIDGWFLSVLQNVA